MKKDITFITIFIIIGTLILLTIKPVETLFEFSIQIIKLSLGLCMIITPLCCQLRFYFLDKKFNQELTLLSPLYSSLSCGLLRPRGN